jgi:hypothetical protein
MVSFVIVFLTYMYLTQQNPKPGDTRRFIFKIENHSVMYMFENNMIAIDYDIGIYSHSLMTEIDIVCTCVYMYMHAMHVLHMYHAV